MDHWAGDRLQLIVPKIRTSATLARRDHRPLTLFADLALPYAGEPATREVRWDTRLLTHAARSDGARAAL